MPKERIQGSAAFKKGPWTPAEDAILVEYVRKHGDSNWNAVQKNSGLSRCGKSCRLRWTNHLRPNLKKGSFSIEEEMLILRLHAQLGNKWARIASHLPGRTDNEIKNYWNTRVKRRQRAGLPLYPVEIERETVVNHHLPPAAHSIHFTPSMPQEGSIGFQLPFSNSLQNNFNLNPLPSLLAEKELSSNQFYAKYVLHRQRNGLLVEAPARNQDVSRWMQCHGDDRWKYGDEPTPESKLVESFEDKHADLPYSIGIRTKREPTKAKINDLEEDVSTMFDQIPAKISLAAAPPTMADTEWYNREMGEMSSEQLTAEINDDIGLEMQKLSSSLSIAPDGLHWNLESCPWSYMPRIC